MKHFAPFFIFLAAFFAAAPVAAAPTAPPRFNTVVVDHFTNANGMSQSQEFIHFFSDDLSEGLQRNNVASQVVDQGTTVPDAAAAKSLVIEGRFLSHEDAALLKPGKLIVEISIYRLSDHALVKTWSATTHFPLKGDQKVRAYAYYAGFAAADAIVDALKTVDLSSITAAPPAPRPRLPTRPPLQLRAQHPAQLPRRHPTPRPQAPTPSFLPALTLSPPCNCLPIPPVPRSRSMAAMLATRPVSSNSGQVRTPSK